MTEREYLRLPLILLVTRRATGIDARRALWRTLPVVAASLMMVVVLASVSSVEDRLPGLVSLFGAILVEVAVYGARLFLLDRGLLDCASTAATAMRRQRPAIGRTERSPE